MCVACAWIVCESCSVGKIIKICEKGFSERYFHFSIFA